MVVAGSISEKNEYLRRGGFSPSQWVLGRAPRGVGHMLDDEEIGHLGLLEGMLHGETAFANRAQYRLTARKGYVKQDCSLRAAKAMLRKAAPMPALYRAGDLVCFHREQRRRDRTSARRAEQRNFGTFISMVHTVPNNWFRGQNGLDAM